MFLTMINSTIAYHDWLLSIVVVFYHNQCYCLMNHCEQFSHILRFNNMLLHSILLSFQFAVL